MARYSDKRSDILNTVQGFKTIDCKDLFNVDEVCDYAVDAAYHDLQLRTITGHGRIPAKELYGFQKSFASLFVQYMKDVPLTTEDAFDLWHGKMCGLFLTKYNNLLAKYNIASVKYGKAQKFINMTLKNLYLYANAEDEYFRFAHIALDQFTLAWYNKYIALRGEKNTEDWGNLDFETYTDIQMKYRGFLRTGANTWMPDNPFKAEFYIWEEGKWIKALNEIKGIADKHNIKHLENPNLVAELSDVIQELQAVI